MAYEYPWKNSSCWLHLPTGMKSRLFLERGSMDPKDLWGTHGTEHVLNSCARPTSVCSKVLLLLVADVNQTAVGSNHQRQSMLMAEYSKGCSSLLFQQRQILWKLCKESEFYPVTSHYRRALKPEPRHIKQHFNVSVSLLKSKL